MGLADWVLVLSILLAVAVAVGLFAERARLPLTVVLAALGFLAGWLGGMADMESPLKGEAFEQVLVLLFLPVLVFEAALNLSVRAFVRNLVPILVLAVPALAISAVVVGLTVSLGLGVPFVAALVFGVLISATDPVAVVAIFRELGVPQRLLTLVEGESLLNDGAAIVLFTILLAMALGQSVDVAGGVGDFVLVFFGGALIGLAIGFVAALGLPWLDRLQAAALSVAVAYGSFVLADHVLEFSGVMATVGAGLVLNGLAPTRASEETRHLWHGLWEALGYTANALLFLLIGLAIDPGLIADNAGAIALAIMTVLVARAAAVVPMVSVLERVADIPRVGWRNEAVLIWGGLRGGVALALALALPRELPQRELFIAMTGGTVLATLLLNATTIEMLVRRLGLDRPSRADRFLAGGARLSGVQAARERLKQLSLNDPEVAAHLAEAEQSARTALACIPLNDAEQLDVVVRRGLHVERGTYQHMHDVGLLPPSVARTLLHEVDDQIERAGLDWTSLARLKGRRRPAFDRLVERFLAWLPGRAGEDARELSYAEASARRLAARRTGEALQLFEQLPNVKAEAVDKARRIFGNWEREAERSLDELDAAARKDNAALRRRQAQALARVASEEILESLASIGLLPETVAQRAAGAVAEDVEEGGGRGKERVEHQDAAERARRELR